MRYAKSETGERIEATVAARGKCFECGSVVFAKCGSLIIPHWAHEPGSECVHATPEPETGWHKSWKEIVPGRCQEVTIRKSGRTKRADILCDTKTVIELQHSQISSGEIEDREEFYGKNMFWLFDSDGRKRIIEEAPSSMWARGVKHFGFRVWLVRMADPVVGVGKCGRSNLVDIGDYVCRIVPSRITNAEQFLATIVSADRVRDDVKSLCVGDGSKLDGFLENLVAFGGRSPELKQRRGVIVSTGEYMSDYCSRHKTSFIVPSSMAQESATPPATAKPSPRKHRSNPSCPSACRHNDPSDPSF